MSHLAKNVSGWGYFLALDGEVNENTFGRGEEVTPEYFAREARLEKRRRKNKKRRKK